jgi:hypothetical protein
MRKTYRPLLVALSRAKKKGADSEIVIINT